MQEQKVKQIELAKAVVEKFDQCDNRRLMEIVTRDEMWIHHFDPENKEKNKVWVASDGERSFIACRNITVKTM